MGADEFALFMFGQNQVAILVGIPIGPRCGVNLHPFSFGIAIMQKVDHGLGFGRGQEDIDIGQLFTQFQRITHAHKTAHQADDFVGMFFFDDLEQTEAAKGFIFGALAHNAGVDDEDIGIIGIGGGLNAHTFKFGGEALCIGLIHLTPQCPDVVLHDRNLSLNDLIYLPDRGRACVTWYSSRGGEGSQAMINPTCAKKRYSCIMFFKCGF